MSRPNFEPPHTPPIRLYSPDGHHLNEGHGWVPVTEATRPPVSPDGLCFWDGRAWRRIGGPPPKGEAKTGLWIFLVFIFIAVVAIAAYNTHAIAGARESIHYSDCQLGLIDC